MEPETANEETEVLLTHFLVSQVCERRGILLLDGPYPESHPHLI